MTRQQSKPTSLPETKRASGAAFSVPQNTAKTLEDLHRDVPCSVLDDIEIDLNVMPPLAFPKFDFNGLSKPKAVGEEDSENQPPPFFKSNTLAEKRVPAKRFLPYVPHKPSERENEIITSCTTRKATRPMKVATGPKRNWWVLPAMELKLRNKDDLYYPSPCANTR